MKRISVIVVLVLAAASAMAAPIVIKIGSIAPENTPWGEQLNKMAAEWTRLSNGALKVLVYHNGIAGDETSMLRQLRLGQLQGCVFTSFGLNNITPEILTLSAPFLIRTNDELNYVMDKNREYMEGLIKKQGIRVLAWSKAGWVRFFSRQPVSTPEDLKKLKLATDPSATTLSQAFKELGYQLVPVSLPDTLVALNSGLIDAIYTSPLTVGGMQLFGITKHMSSFKLSPFLGAVVISEKAWAKIPEALKPILIESSKAIETNLDRQIMGFEEESIAAMVKYGLIIDQVSEAQMALWLRDVEISMPKTLGTSFDRGMYELITKQLEAIRSGKK